MPSRRELLAALGVGSLAGCLGGENTATPTESAPSRTPTATPTATATPAPAAVGETATVEGVEMTLERVTVRHSLVYQASADTKGVQHRSGERFLFAELSAPESAVPPAGDRFSLAIDDIAEFAPVSCPGYYWWTPSAKRGPYTADPDGQTAVAVDEPGGWLAFPVPEELDAESVGITLGGSGWTLPERTVESLRQPLPTFDLVSFEYPETVTPNEAFTVQVTVENTGPVEGTFRGVLNVAGINYAYYPYPFRLALPPGQRGTWEKQFGPDHGLDEVGDIGRLDLQSPVGDHEGEIEVVAGTAVGTATES